MVLTQLKRRAFAAVAALTVMVSLVAGSGAASALASSPLGYVQGQCETPLDSLGITGAVPGSLNLYKFAQHPGVGSVSNKAVADGNGTAIFEQVNLIRDYGYKAGDVYSVTFFSGGQKLNTVRAKVIVRCAV